MIIEILLLAILCSQLWSIRRCEHHCARNERWLKYMVAATTTHLFQGLTDGTIEESTYKVLRKLLDDVVPEER